MIGSQALRRHVVRVYLDEVTTDSYGNAVTRPSETGTVIECTITQRSTAADKAGAPEQPRWSLMAAPSTPLGKWSRIVTEDGRQFTVDSWPRLVGPDGSAAQHVAAELIETR